MLFLYSRALLAQPAIKYGFENIPNGTEYTQVSWQAEGFTVPWVDGFDQQRAYIDNMYAHNGSNSLRIFYPAAGWGTANSGAQAPLIVAPADQYYMSYWLRFSDNFSWGGTSQGGKLPGLSGGDRCSGCEVCTGSNGFTARLMWRPAGKAVLYLYHMDKINLCGDDHDLLNPDGTNVMFEKGKWYNVVERVKINSDTSHNGEVEIWINGNHAILKTGIKFVTDGSKVDNLYFSTFHGGSGAEWAPGVDCYIWFDDFIVSANPIDVLNQHCSSPQLEENKNLCGKSTITLNAGLNAINRKFYWYKDGVPTGTDSPTLTVDKPGKYKVTVDSAGCILSDETTVSNTIHADMGLDKNICKTAIITLPSGETDNSFTYAWVKDNNIILNETSPSLKTSQAGIYRVTISGGSCASQSDEVVITSSLLNVKHDTICEAGTANLAVNGNYQYDWFTVPQNGSSIYSGKTYSTNIYINTVFYVEDISSKIYYVGKKTKGPNVWNDNRYPSRGLVFDVLQQVKIDSVTVFTADAGGPLTIKIYDASGKLLGSSPVSMIITGQNRIPVNVSLNKGTGYRMKADGTFNLQHDNENSDAIVYPYTVNGVISITTTDPTWMKDKPWYPFFYNWRVSTGTGVQCTRTPVYAVIDPSACPTSVQDKNSKQTNSVYFSSSEKTIHVSIPENTGSLTELYDINGRLLFNKLSSEKEIIITKQLNQGVYFILISDENMNQQRYKIITY